MAIITKNLGIVSPVPADEWNASTTYQKLNIITHNDSVYIAKQGSTGIEPGVTTNWQTYWMFLVSSTGGGGSGVDVVQTTGQSTTAVMSQKAVTDELNTKQNSLTFDDSPTANSSNPVKSSGIKISLDNKVDKVTGKGLSTNDFTNDEKTKLAKIEYVKANPTESGTVDLTKLKVGNTVYNVPQGGGGGGGTTVIANPTLTGSETNLTALQVGDTKYGIKALKVTIW